VVTTHLELYCDSKAREGMATPVERPITHHLFYLVFYLTKFSLTIRLQFIFISYYILYLNGPANLTEMRTTFLPWNPTTG
jgi:hypothetical protein